MRRLGITLGQLIVGALILLPLPPVCLGGGWTDERLVGPVICRANFSLAGYDSLLGQLGQVQQSLSSALGVEPCREPIELYLFSDKSAYSLFIQQRFPQVPFRRALFVKGSGPGRVFAYRNRELEVDVRHESTHALLHGALPMVPLWLDEGLAEYFEVPPEQRADANPHLAAIKWNLRLGVAPRIVPLEQKRDLADMTATDYRNAWAWVHFMLHGPREAHQELVGFLADIHAGTPPGQLSKRLEQRLPGVEKRLAQHFKDWKK